ncbi:TetR/AcrR family transcriptional regulator [Actinomycetes bacterium KLBMP 9797]
MNDILWGGRPPPSRGPKPALSLDRIAATAIEIADAEGLAAVSMQRVAADLGFTKMSLYRYLPGKAELVALMVERAVGEPPALDAADWRAGLAEWSRRLLARYLRHPWTLEATVGPRPLGPHELGWMDRALALLAPTGLSGADRLDTIAVLAGHARMIAQQAAPGPAPEAQLVGQLAGILREHGERFPALAASVADAARGGADQAFDFGLDRILDGLAALIARRAYP